ncbi:hypothetical protein MMC34_004927 [Xylographa carneopallida]|nr:hypothetical protein [Xylographa carneopallida]
MAVPGILQLQGRSRSDQPQSDGTAAISMSLVLEETEAFPEERQELKRACSVPSALHPSSPRSASVTAKPSFKIQLPPRDFPGAQPTPFTPPGQPISQAQERPKLLQATIMLDSPTSEEHSVVPSLITPLATPTYERLAPFFRQEIVDDSVVSHNQLSTTKPRSGPAVDMDLTVTGAPPTDAENLDTLQDGDSRPGNIGTDNDHIVASSGACHEDVITTEPWLQEAMRVSGNSLFTLIYGVRQLKCDLAFELSDNSTLRGTIKVVAQTLPAPVSLPPSKPTEPAVTPTTAFPSLMGVLQGKLLTSSTQYIQVTHAVPANFALTSLPSSPPSTPGLMNPPEDYFTSRIFSSAVALVDRHDTFTRRNDNTMSPATLPPSLAVPPASIDFALLERFIPPSSTQEFMDLFTLGSPSILADRLVELSPDGGTLLFIYPTRVGAETFKTDYLNPILDPILRSVITSHCLSLDIGVELGTMASANHLVPFEGLKRKVNILLRGLSRGTGPTSKARYTLLHANKSTVHVHRKVWTQWYLKQEAPKIRHVTTQYLSRARKPLGNENVNQVMLMRSIVEGVEQRDYVHGGSPTEQDGIEVGIFVIRRSE